MADERKISMAEVRKTISTSLAAAFGFVIALLWNNVVTGGLKVAGVDTTFANITPIGWIGYLVTALAIPAVLIVLFIVIGRWGGKKIVRVRPGESWAPGEALLPPRRHG